MGTLESFLSYAAEFEKSYADDDWSRLERFFADDAVYRVESNRFGCELTGPDAILAGMKKSLDGFDRRFDTREIAVQGAPEVEGDELSVAWTVTYTKDDLPTFVLEGRSEAHIVDGRIALLVDSYDPKIDAALDDWVRETGVPIDPSYA